MGPLWAWVILWLVSAYGLVLLLRRSAFQVDEEPVPTLVATPKPVEPAPLDASLEAEAPGEAALSEEGELTVSIPALEAEAIANPLDLSEEPLARALQAIEAEPELSIDQGQVELDAVLPASAADLEDEVPIPSAPLEGPEEVGGVESEPWIREREETEASEPWIKEKDERTTDAPWIQERELPEASEPWHSEDEQTSSVAAATQQGADEDEDEVVFRSIDLESLTLGLEATEIQALYGSPGHMSKVGDDGEQWRYPLSATDEQGAGLDGVLVLEFQRGRLVRKSLEEGQEV